MIGRYRVTVYDAINNVHITMATALTWRGVLRKGLAVIHAEGGRIVFLWRGTRALGSL